MFFTNKNMQLMWWLGSIFCVTIPTIMEFYNAHKIYLSIISKTLLLHLNNTLASCNTCTAHKVHLALFSWGSFQNFLSSDFMSNHCSLANVLLLPTNHCIPSLGRGNKFEPLFFNNLTNGPPGCRKVRHFCSLTKIFFCWWFKTPCNILEPYDNPFWVKSKWSRKKEEEEKKLRDAL